LFALLTTLLFMIVLFFSFNIGASGAAAAMGIAYGSGAIKKRKKALLVCGIGIFLGASLGGGEVVRTLGSEIIPENIISIKIAFIIISSASLCLFIANITGIPLSTSEVTVGSLVGVGIAFKVLYVKKLATIIMCWLLIPLLAFLLAFLANQIINKIEYRLPFLTKGRSLKFLTFLVIGTGFLEAFSAGMNNVANAVGPLVGAGLMSVGEGTFFGGICVALGAIFLGSKVIETNGKKIVDLSLLQGSAVSGIGGMLVIIASLFGIPIPHTQITTCSILGVGASVKGKEIWRKAIIIRLAKVWVFSPLGSLVISYTLVKIFIHLDLSWLIFVFVFILGAYMLNMKRSRVIYKEKAAFKK